MEEGQKNFDEVSKTLKREVERFEVSPYPSSPPSSHVIIQPCHISHVQEERAQEFKSKFIAYLEALMHLQQEVQCVQWCEPSTL